MIHVYHNKFICVFFFKTQSSIGLQNGVPLKSHFYIQMMYLINKTNCIILKLNNQYNKSLLNGLFTF